MYEEDIQSSDSGEYLIIPIKTPGNGSSEELIMNEFSVIRSILSGEKVDTSSSGTSEFIEDRLAEARCPSTVCPTTTRKRWP